MKFNDKKYYPRKINFDCYEFGGWITYGSKKW